MRGTGILAVLACAWLAPRAAEACSCRHAEPGPGVVRTADVVFEGTVRRRWLSAYDRRIDEIDRAFESGERNAVFAVRRVWRGELGQRVTIKSPRQVAACGERFVVGASYIVFADLLPDGSLWGLSCSHTTRVRDAGELVRYLGDADVPRSAGGCSLVGAHAGGTLGLLGLRRRSRSTPRRTSRGACNR